MDFVVMPSVSYRVIVADPPWPYDRREPGIRGQGGKGWPEFGAKGADKRRIPLPYPSMCLDDIRAIPVASVADDDCHLFVWTTNRFLEVTFGVVEAWGWRPSQTLTWCKPPRGLGPGGLFANTTEFVIYARRGKPLPYRPTFDSTWWEWNRRKHSEKPEGFQNMLEALPGPKLEMFARRRRLGWDAWGNEVSSSVIFEA